MKEPKNETQEELDCHVTVNDGSYMTCDMIEEDHPQEAEASEDYHI